MTGRFNALMVTAVGALVLSASAYGLAADKMMAAGSDGFSLAVDDNGKISLPDVDYRKDWVALGSWAVAADEGEGSAGIHAVYTQLEAVEAYRKTGAFPDGTVLIKELFSTTTEDMTTGTVSRAADTTGWFVMVKDATGRFPGNNLWGDGWGWAYFDAGNRLETTSTDYRTDCKGCHVPAQNTDWVYTQAYPVLKGK